MLVFGGAAHAATPNPGDRAGSIAGWDMVGQRSSSLSEHLGKWVFLDFWASWCGPCMHELPNLLEATSDLRKSGRLVLYTVTLDDERSTPALRKVLTNFAVDYPVIYDGLGWNALAAKSWGVNSIPATFLIDPQGNVVATNLRGSALRPALEFFVNSPGPIAPIGVRGSAVEMPSGDVKLLLDLSSPSRKTLKVKYNYYHQRLKYAEDDLKREGRPVSSEFVNPDQGALPEQIEVSFENSGERIVEVLVPAVQDTQRFFFTIQVLVPGTEDLNEGQGIWVTSRGRVNLNND
jgi:thiol-disulfide isomerase/thioredoxin